MPEVRPAVLRRDAEGLSLTGRDVGPVRARRRQDGQRDGLDDRDEQGPRGMGQLPDRGHRLEQAEEVRLRREHARDRAVRLGEHPLQRGEVRRPRRRSVGDERDLVERQAAAEVGPERVRGSADGRRD